MTLQERILGSTDLSVTPLGLGTVELGMPYGLAKDEPPSDAACIRLLHEAVDRGIGYIDTAAAYGRSEELIGRAFADRPRPVIATKVSMRDADGTPWTDAVVAGRIESSVERSRKLLGADVLDLVQVHNADAIVTGQTALLDAMRHQQERGRVRYWGASTYGHQAAQAVLQRGAPLQTLQIAYSLLDRTLEADVIPAATTAGVGLVLRSVFLQGVLSERRHTLAASLRPLADAAASAAGVAAGLGTSLPDVALRFAMYEAGAQVTLVGTANIDELVRNIDAAQAGPLPRDAVQSLRDIVVADESLLNPGNWPKS